MERRASFGVAEVHQARIRIEERPNVFQMASCCGRVNRVIDPLRDNSTAAIPCLLEQLGN